MTPKKALIAAGLALLAALGSAPAAAQVVASASLSDFRFELIDLNPDDGIDASISFGDGVYYGVADVFGERWFSYLVATAVSVTSGTINVASNFAEASTTLQADGISSAVETFDHSAFAGGFSNFAFTLSANTRLIVSAFADLNAAPGPDDSFTFATASIFGSYSRSPDIMSFIMFDTMMVTPFGQDSGRLSVLAESGDDWANGNFYFQTTAQATGSPAPIPEPEAAWMMLAGLGVLGTLARRRKSSPTPST